MSTNVVYPVALATNGEYRLSCLVLGCDSRGGFVGLYMNIYVIYCWRIESDFCVSCCGCRRLGVMLKRGWTRELTIIITWTRCTEYDYVSTSRVKKKEKGLGKETKMKKNKLLLVSWERLCVFHGDVSSRCARFSSRAREHFHRCICHSRRRLAMAFAGWISRENPIEREQTEPTWYVDHRTSKQTNKQGTT